MHRSRRSCLLAVLAVLALSCRGRSHDQEEGLYLFTAEAVTRDDCGRLANSSAIFEGELVLAGDIVRLKRGPYGMQLIGSYLSKVERFRIDGSVGNLIEQIRGAECLIDQVSVHVDATTESPTVFTGTARLQYEADTDACSCEVWTTYRAVKQ